MDHYFDLYRYQYVSGELEFGRKPLPKHGMALEKVLIEDFDHKEELKFTSSRGNQNFKHEYVWSPKSDGVVTVFKLGHGRENGFSFSTIVVSLRPSSPFILIWGYDKSLKWAYDALKNALDSAFKGRGTMIKMTPCNQDAEALYWKNYMEKVYEKAKKHKDTTISKIKEFENIKLGKTAPGFSSCVNESDKADLVIMKVSTYMKGKHAPKDIFRPIAAVIAANVIRNPTWPEMASQFNLDHSLKSSFHRLIRKDCKTYMDDHLFDEMVIEFRKFKSF